MNTAMYVSYRVICSRNPEHPERIFVDICRDGFCSHDILFQMQQKLYQDKKLKRIFNDSRGIIIREARDGSFNLVYTKHRDKMAQQTQARLRELVDPEIVRVFKNMRKAGKIQTISVQVKEVYNEALIKANHPKRYAESLREEEALKTTDNQLRLQKIKKIRQVYYARQKYASAPHLSLMLKQYECRGD